MEYRTSSPNRSNVRTFIVSLLTYVLLTGQLAPLAMAANAKLNRVANRRAPLSNADKSLGAAQPTSSETHFSPVPKPLAQPAAPIQPLAVNIVATKTDNRTVAQPAAPGDTINYTVVIQNLGSTDATSVTFTDTIDANTTLVPNSIVSTPVANNDTYNVVGNVRIQPNAAQGLLANDFNPDNGNATGITASGPATSTQGGTVTVNADGSFSYNPAPGFAGTDTFTYTLTVTATGKTDTATVTLNVGNGTATPGTNVIWFINSAAAPGGDGRLTSPFNCFVGAGCFSAIAADDPGDAIFLFNGAYIGGYSLLANQKLIGQGAGATLESISGVTVQAYSNALPATNGNPDNVTMTTVAAATNALTVSTGGILLRGFTIGSTTGAKIFGSAFGTLTAGNTTTPDLKLNGTGQALNLTTGTFAATSAFTSVATTSSATQGITLAGVGGTVAFGSATVSGATTQGILIGTTTANINFGDTTVTGGGDAISLQNNSAGTRTFGAVTTSGNTGIGFSHTAAGGTTTVTGATTITNPGSTGISIQNSTTAISFAGTTVNKGASAGTGVDLGNNTGNTTFNSLSITTSNGTGLLGVGNTGQINVTTNAGSIASTNGPAINITKAIAPATPITLNFTSVSSTNSLTTGVTLDRVSGNAAIGTTTTTNPTGIGISVTNTSAGGTMNFGNTTSNTTAGAGVSLGTNAGAVSFAALNIAPDAGVAAFSLASSTGITTSTSGTISTTDAPAVSVNNSPLNMTLTSVTADNTGDADSCVSLTTASGTLNMQGGTLTGGTGAAFLVSGGNPTVTFSGTITQNSAARVVDIQNTTANTITFNTGAITGGASSTGVLISGANGNVSFANGLTLGTSGARMTNQAMTITNGTGTYSLGAVSIFTNNVSGLVATNADGTLNSVSGTVDSSNTTAINIDGPAGLTTLGMTLTRVDSAGGTANGISIQDTNGSFTINGDGTNTSVGGNSTGGIISGKSGADGNNAQGNGVFLSNTQNITLRRMTINGTNQNHGIRGLNSSNFTLEFSTVTGTNGTSATLDESSIKFDGWTGTGLITSCVIDGGLENNLYLVNASGTLNRLTISGSTFGFNNTASGNNNILIESQNAGTTLNFTLKSSLIKGARADWVNVTASSSSTMDALIGGPLVADGNTFDNLGANAHPNPAAGGNRIVTGSIGNQTVDIRNNTTKGSKGEAIRVRSSGLAAVTGLVNARVRNNTIGVAATANSGSAESFGIFAFGDLGGDMNIAITNNQVFQYNNHGIALQFGQDTVPGNSAFNVTVTGNTVSNPGNINTDFNGINLNNGTIASDAFTTCADIGGAGVGNNVVGSGSGGIPPNNANIRLRQRQSTTVRLPGYAGANNNDAAVVTYLTGRNTLTTAAASNSVPTGGGFIGGAACTAPSVPLAPQTLEMTSDAVSAPGVIETPGAVAQEPITIGRLEILKAGVAGLVSPSESKAPMFVPDAGVRGKVETTEGKPKARKPQAKDVDDITPNLANFPLTIGTLGAGKSVTITFSVTVNNPLVPPTTTSVSNQGTVSGNDGATPFNVLTDDPDVPGTNNPTVTGITPPPDINIRDARVAEPASGTTSMLFTVTLSVPAPGSVSVNYATANGGATPATGGTCAGGADYETTNGTVNFIAGQQVQTVAIPVCSDPTAEGDETFLVNLSSPTNGIIVDGQATGTITPNTPGVTLISELRTSGPSGTNDDFVEIYNNTDSPLAVAASDASAGYGLFKMGAACGDTPVLIGTIPNGTPIPARGHYLLIGSAYSLANYGGAGAAAGNLTMSADIENDRNVALFTTSNILNISSTTRLDAVGFGTNTGNNCDLLREGTNLGAASGSASQHSFVRKATTGLPQDTNDNAADFAVVATDSSVPVGTNTLPILGAPGPENLAAPIQRNSTVKASLVDPAAASTVTPNRVRDTNSYIDTLTPSAPNGGAPATNPYTLGTLLIRRKFTNNTGAAVTKLRFRIVDVTSTNAPPGGGGQADMRTLTSTTQPSVTITGGGTIVVQGLTLEQTTVQNRGGGLNSSVFTLATPIANNASINVNFLLGVAAGGSYRFFINVEALP